jgi:hypothetical protein
MTSYVVLPLIAFVALMLCGLPFPTAFLVTLLVPVLLAINKYLRGRP